MVDAVSKVQSRLKSVVREPLLKATELSKTSDLAWRYTFNFPRTITYRARPDKLAPSSRLILDDLNRNGIAVTPVQNLLSSPDAYGELASTVERLEKEQAGPLEAQRREASGPETSKKKAYVYHYVPDPGIYDTTTARPQGVDDFFARFALQEPLVRLVNEYFAMYTRLRYYDVWHNFPTEGPEMASQQWHRDPEDRCIIKMFVYLGDVGEDEGPFTYAPGTHYKGSVRATRPDMFRGKRGMYLDRVSDEEMATVVPEEKWIRAHGPAATAVIADTSGYHKGGTRSRDRLLYMCMFSSRISGLFGRSRVT